MCIYVRYIIRNRIDKLVEITRIGVGDIFGREILDQTTLEGKFNKGTIIQLAVIPYTPPPEKRSFISKPIILVLVFLVEDFVSGILVGAINGLELVCTLKIESILRTKYGWSCD